ncbi:hypothetical protein PENSPDRAFT_755412 [Peniophora sp. CONT]|nr:hypothetical protein PENSPDRAFT_755412 [Peniophora sp. CONT]
MAQDNQSLLDIFRAQWQAELQQKRTRVGRPNHDYLWAIWTLPDDVMCELFYAAAELEPPRMAQILPTRQENISALTASGLGWMRLTHVCQSWRAILLGMSVLWGTVAFTFPSLKAFPTLFARAGGALVDIAAFLDDEAWPRIEAAISLPLARSLRVQGRLHPRIPAFLTLNSEPMRWLRDLRLTLGFDKEPDARSSRYDLCIDAPGLESACFEMCPGSSFVLRFTTTVLRHLEVRADYKLSFSHQAARNESFKWVVNLMRASPLLEVLSISLCQRQHTLDWDTLLQGQSFQLANLKSLTLEDDSRSHLVPLMRQICAPESPPPTLSASCGTFRGEPHNIGFLEQLQQYVRASTFAHGFGGYLCRSGHGALFLQAAKDTEYLTLRSMPASEDPATLAYHSPDAIMDPFRPTGELEDAVSLNVTMKKPTHWHEDHGVAEVEKECFAALLNSIPNKKSVEQLFLRIEPPQSAAWTHQCCEHLLRPMTALHTLCLLPSIHSHQAVNLVNHEYPPLFPSLHTLIIVMDVPSAYQTYAKLGDLLDTLFEKVVSYLEHRLHAGILVPVHTLRITGHWPSEDMRDLLRDRTWRHLAWVAGLAHIVLDERVV